VLKHDGHFYHLNPDLFYDTNAIVVLCPVCAKDPMMKKDESIAAGNDYGRLGYLKPYQLANPGKSFNQSQHCISNKWFSRMFEKTTLCGS
jgi:hypothetical protein